MNLKHLISVVDSHTVGEPIHIIVDGFGKVCGATMTELMDYLKAIWIRFRNLLCENLAAIETAVGSLPSVIPEISCRPFITGFHDFAIDSDDVFAKGFTL